MQEVEYGMTQWIKELERRVGKINFSSRTCKKMRSSAIKVCLLHSISTGRTAKESKAINVNFSVIE